MIPSLAGFLHWILPPRLALLSMPPESPRAAASHRATVGSACAAAESLKIESRGQHRVPCAQDRLSERNFGLARKDGRGGRMGAWGPLWFSCVFVYLCAAWSLSAMAAS